jgi:hypothetical protein
MSRRGNWISSLGNRCQESFICRQTKKYLAEEKRQRTRFHIRLHQTYTRRETRNNATVKQHTNKQPLSLSLSLTHTHTHTLSLSLCRRQCLLQYNTAQNTRSLSRLHTNVYALDQKPTLKKRKAKPNQKDANTDQEQQGWTKLKNPRLRFTVTKETMNKRGGMSGEHTRKQTQK